MWQTVYKCLFSSGTARPRALVRLPALGREGGKAFWSQGRPADSSASLTVPLGPRWRLQGLEACVLGEERHVSHGKKRSQYLPSVAFHTNRSSCHIDQEPGPEHSPRPPAGKAVPISQMGVWCGPPAKTPASSRDAGLTPSEVSAPPGGLSAVPAAGTLCESADVGKEAVGGRGICNHSRPIAVAVCSGQVLPSGHCGAGRSAGPPHCLAGNHQVEQKGRKAGGTPAICPSLRKCLIL